MKIYTIILLLLFALVQSTFAQTGKTLNLYKPGKVKVIKFKVGDVLIFKLKGEKWYHTLPIRDLKGDKVVFDASAIDIKDIDAIKVGRDANEFMKTLEYSLYTFGVSWLFYSGVDYAMTNDTDAATTIIVPATAGVLGLLIRWISQPKRHKLGNRKWLKIMEPDLDFQGA